MAFVLMVALSRLTHPEVYANLMSIGPVSRVMRVFSRARTGSEVAARGRAERDRVGHDG